MICKIIGHKLAVSGIDRCNSHRNSLYYGNMKNASFLNIMRVANRTHIPSRYSL